jgi:phosphatidyl-myo-inositol dimannoside synthase
MHDSSGFAGGSQIGAVASCARSGGVLRKSMVGTHGACIPQTESGATDIVVVTPSLWESGGGIARITRSLVKACDEYCQNSGRRLRVLSLLDSLRSVDPRYMSSASEFVPYGGHRAAMAYAFLKMKSRICIFSHVNLSTLSLLVPWRRYAVVVHGIEVWDPLPFTRRVALRRADEVWAVSGYTAREVIRLHGVADQRIQVIHNCLDPFWNTAPVGRTIRDTQVVLAVGRMSRADVRKGIDVLIAAFAVAANDVPAIELKIVGSGDDVPRLRTLAAETPVWRKIEFIGAATDEKLAALYHECDIFALPSGKEGFGLVYLEAMAAGKPVVAARATAVEEVVDRSSGILVPFGDVAQTAAAIVRLARDGSLRQSMGEAGRERVRTTFSFDRYEARVHAALARLV